MASDMEGELENEAIEDDELADPTDESLLEEDLDESIAEDDDDELVGDIDEIEVVEGDGVVVVALPAEGEETGEDDDDEPDDDDVEASLDVILKERLVVNEEEEEEDEEDDATDPDDRADGTARVLPKQPGEFVCQSCFLVKNQTQLADKKKMLCRDCV